MFDSLKIQNVNNFYFEKNNRLKKKKRKFQFLKGRYFVMDRLIDMNVDVF